MQAIHFTEKALREISKARLNNSPGEDYFLRVGIKGTVHGVQQYLLGFDIQREEDLVYEVEGMKILIDKKHSMHVMGMEIDYSDEVGRTGFVFNNPTQKKIN